jgi:chorismate synthase
MIHTTYEASAFGAPASIRRKHGLVPRRDLSVTYVAMSLRLITAGESHGPGLTCILEGMPAGLTLERDQINRDLARRQLGHGRGGRMKIERDQAEVTGGVRHGRTLGGPIALQVTNRDYANWEERMNPWPVDAAVAEVHLPRPGHADLVGTQKYGLTDVRNVLERASARETAARVAGGAVAKAFLKELGVEVFSHVIQITSVHAPRKEDLTPQDFANVDESPVRCLDPEATKSMVAEIDRLRKANESLGGVFEVRAFGLVPGLGSHVSWEERLDGRLGQAILSIQAIKAVSIGDGTEVAGLPGSQAHDEIFYDDRDGYYRQTNRSGGVEGGMTTGAPLVVRASMKPLPTLTKPLRSVDIATHEPAEALRERTDSCTVPAAGVVGEAMVAFVLADAYRRKFGGDHIDDVRGSLRAYEERIAWRRS